MAIINSKTRQVAQDQWSWDVQMVGGVGIVEDIAISANSRITAFSQTDDVVGSLRAIPSPGVGFTVRSSEASDTL